MAIIKLTPQLTFRAGYQGLYAVNVALAPEQFNPVAPALFSPPVGVGRVPFINTHGDVLYHGGTAGFERTW